MLELLTVGVAWKAKCREGCWTLDLVWSLTTPVPAMPEHILAEPTVT